MEGILRTKYSYKDAMAMFNMLSALGKLKLIKNLQMSLGGRPNENTFIIRYSDADYKWIVGDEA